jgi:hypothetical protein
MQVQDLIEKYNAIVEARGGAPFHTFVLTAFTRSAHDQNDKYQKCDKRAAQKTSDFIASCRDVSSPDYMRFRKEFKSNEVNVKKHFLRHFLRQDGYYTMEFEDKAYERKIFRGLEVSLTQEDKEVAELFEDLLLSKWRAVGYAGLLNRDDDYSTIIEFWESHKLSTGALPAIMKTPEFIKKSML